MNPLSMYDQFEQKVRDSTGKFTKSWSSLKPVFDVLEAQLKQAVQRRDVKQLSLKPLNAAIATAERDKQQRAVKYKGAIDWLRARWGADNGHAGALRAMIELEQRLIARVNEALVKRRTVDVNTIADLSLVGQTLIDQASHFKEKYDTTKVSAELRALVASVAGDDPEYVTLLEKVIPCFSIPAQGEQNVNQNRDDVFTLLALCVVKLIATDTGRSLLREIVKVLGKRTVNVRFTWEGFATDFDSSHTLPKGTGQLNVADDVVMNLKTDGPKQLSRTPKTVKGMGSIVKPMLMRQEMTGRAMSLKVAGTWSSFHEIHVGIPTSGSSQPVLFLAPHYVTFFHELCHLVRLVQGAAWPMSVELAPDLKDSYENAEELFNIQAESPFFSEYRLLAEIRLPRRVTHAGMIVPAPTGKGIHPWNTSEAAYTGQASRRDSINVINGKIENELGFRTPFKSG